MMAALARLIADDQLVGSDDRRRRQAVPERHGFIVLSRFVGSAMLQLNPRILAEGHQVGQQEAVGGLDLVFRTDGRGGVPGAGGMAGKRNSHVLASPVVASPAPFLRAGALGLRRAAVV